MRLAGWLAGWLADDGRGGAARLQEKEKTVEYAGNVMVRVSDFRLGLAILG